MTKDIEKHVDAPQVLAPRKPYRTPRIIEFGHISKLTAGQTGTHTDKGHAGNQHGQG